LHAATIFPASSNVKHALLRIVSPFF